MNGTIVKRIIKKGKDKNGKTKTDLEVYDVYYRYTDPATGKSKQTSKKGFRRKGDAENFLLEVNVQLNNSAFVLLTMTKLGDYLNDWFASYVETNLRPSTISGYRVNIEKHIIPHIGNIKLQDLTPHHIDILYSKLQKDGRSDSKGGLSARSVIYVHRVLKQALEHAVKKKLVTYNAAKDVTNLPRAKKYKAEIYNMEEIQQLLRIIKNTYMEVPLTLCVLLGLRRGELLALNWGDISFKNQTLNINKQIVREKNRLKVTELKITDPKSEESKRIIVYPNMINPILIAHKEKQEETKVLLQHEYINKDLVVCQADGSYIDPSSFSKSFSRFLKKNKLKHIRLHDLRHSAATLMLESGINLKQVSEILGHSSIVVTSDFYGHVTLEAKRKAATKIEQRILESY